MTDVAEEVLAALGKRPLSGSEGYKDLIESMGVRVVVEYETDDYQGDIWWLLKASTGWGYAHTGYGCCSVCDALQAASGNIEELESLRLDLWRGATWRATALDMRTWLREHDWAGDYAKPSKKFLADADALLTARIEKGD